MKYLRKVYYPHKSNGDPDFSQLSNIFDANDYYNTSNGIGIDSSNSVEVVVGINILNNPDLWRSVQLFYSSVIVPQYDIRYNKNSNTSVYTSYGPLYSDYITFGNPGSNYIHSIYGEDSYNKVKSNCIYDINNLENSDHLVGIDIGPEVAFCSQPFQSNASVKYITFYSSVPVQYDVEGQQSNYSINFSNSLKAIVVDDVYYSNFKNSLAFNSVSNKIMKISQVSL